MGALLPTRCPCASTSPGTVVLGRGGSRHCHLCHSPFAPPPLPFITCGFSAINSWPCFSSPQKAGLTHSPKYPRQRQPGSAELELLLPGAWPQESTGPPGWELGPAAPSVWHNYTWEEQFCLRNFLQGICGDYWTKVCRRKLYFFLNCSIFPSILNVWKSTSLHSLSQQIPVALHFIMYIG